MSRPVPHRKLSTVPSQNRLDATDARVLLALNDRPRATTIALADRVGLSRNTVQARLGRIEEALGAFEHRVTPESLGYPLTAFVTTQVTQRRLDEVATALAAVPEVLAVHGVSGQYDLLVHVVAADADDLYQVAGRILAIPGVERTNVALVMRQLLAYRVTPLLQRLAE